MSGVWDSVPPSSPSQTSTTTTTTDVPRRKTQKVEIPRENPDSNLCSYYLVRKQRFCRTVRSPGSSFCHTHNIYSTPPLAHEVSRQDIKTAALTTSNAATLSDAEKDVDNCHNGNIQRVPCPINPNHTVYRSRLEKHMRVCPDLRFVNSGLPYFRQNYHANRSSHLADAIDVRDEVKESGDPISSEAKILEKQSNIFYTHKNLAQEELNCLIDRVTSCYTKFIKDQIVVLGVENDGSDTAEIPKMWGDNIKQSKKHAPQHQGLLRCLGEAAARSHQEHHYSQNQEPDRESFRCLDGFLELGAGKGSLSVALQQVLVNYIEYQENSSGGGMHCGTALERQLPFLQHVSLRPVLGVVDMDGFRRKGDARVSHSKIPLCRLRINLKDMDLTEAFVSKTFSTARVSSGDALCSERGERSGKDLQEEEGNDASGSLSIQREVSDWAVLGKHLCGACTDFALSCITEEELVSRARVRMWLVVLATCCHHRCELKHFNPLACDSTDVSSAQPSPETILRLPGTDFTITAKQFACLASMSSWAVSGAFVEESRREVGYYCKRILDSFRVSYLRQHGYTAWLCQYTEREVTEENVCIVAYKDD
ncbi:unnamed protein product [Phytomonas sp. EM1]|nr:unnamed protein product [Phytomonas sp. EM1]|eukprot:CCW65206.1 unnamed protein product [Phytomonas sp. isolate EM1]